MTKRLDCRELAKTIEKAVPGAVAEATAGDVLVHSPSVLQVARFLKDAPGYAFDFLVSVSAIDYLDYFEVVYHLTSIKHNHAAVLKTRVYSREEPVVPSVVTVWQGADFQEREVYDLMGIRFQGHPNLKRIMLWEGFEGHPLRKDYISRTPA